MNGIDTFDTRATVRENLDLRGIDSRTIGAKLKELHQLILHPEVVSLDRIRIGNYLCHKLYGMISLPDPTEERVITALSNILLYDDTIGYPHRMYYTRFADQRVGLKISERAYRQNLSTAVAETPYFEVLKYILRSPYLSSELRVSVLDEFEVIFADGATSNFSRMQIADIYLLNGLPQRGDEMLQWIRQAEQKEAVPEGDATGQKTVYQDSQNVHDHTVNESCLTAGKNLILDMQKDDDYKDMIPTQEVIDVLTARSPGSKELVDKILERFNIDTAIYRIDGCQFNLYRLFAALWYFIIRHEQREALLDRLMEELASAHRYCSSGHMTRLINVIQGFLTEEQEERYAIRISTQAQMRAVIKTLLDREIMNAPMEVIDSMIEEDQTLFFSHVRAIINDEMEKLISEYQDGIEYIPDAVAQYTKVDGWEIRDNRLQLEF